LSNSKMEPLGSYHSDLMFLAIRSNNLMVQNVFTIPNRHTVPN
jgi:hypothetical protein